VSTNRGQIETDIVVNAAGLNAPTIGKMVGVAIPIKPIRGQEVVTERVPPLIKCYFSSASTLRRKLAQFYQDHLQTFRSTGSTEIFGAHQTTSGNLLLGSTYEEVLGSTRETTTKAIRGIVKNAVRILPALKRVHMIRAFAGFRPYSPDGLPIVGKVDGIEGFLLACGHGGDGIALAPTIGELISDLIVDGKTSIPLEPFRLSRFARSVS
jgi:sarcosine oxidase subunit beta